MVEETGFQRPQVKAVNALKSQALKWPSITSIILYFSKQPWPAQSPCEEKCTSYLNGKNVKSFDFFKPQ